MGEEASVRIMSIPWRVETVCISRDVFIVGRDV